MGLHVQGFVEKTRMVTVLTTAAGLAFRFFAVLVAVVQ